MCARWNKFSFSFTAFFPTAHVCQKKDVKEQCTVIWVGQGRYNFVWCQLYSWMDFSGTVSFCGSSSVHCAAEHWLYILWNSKYLYIKIHGICIYVFILIFFLNLLCKHWLSLYAKFISTQTKPLITGFIIFLSLYKEMVSWKNSFGLSFQCVKRCVVNSHSSESVFKVYKEVEEWKNFLSIWW